MDLLNTALSLSRKVTPSSQGKRGKRLRTSLLAGFWMAFTALQATAGEVVRVHNWAEYIDPEVIDDFQRETGIRVDYSQFTTAAELEADLAAGQRYDVIVPTDFQLERMIKANQLLELDLQLLPNRAEVSGELLARLSSKNRAERFVVPYMWGVAGLVVHQKAAARVLQGPVTNSWGLLFDPANANSLKSCGAVLHNEPEQMLSVFLNYRGKNLRSQSARGIEKATRDLHDLGIPLGPSGFADLVEQLAQGRICATVTWNGIASLANQNGELRFLIPQEGGLMFIDSLAIPRDAPNKAGAYRFINYLLDPRNAARNARATHFTPSLDLTRERNRRLLPDIALPSQEERRRLFFMERLSDSQKRAVDAAWSQLDGRDRM